MPYIFVDNGDPEAREFENNYIHYSEGNTTELQQAMRQAKESLMAMNRNSPNRTHAPVQPRHREFRNVEGARLFEAKKRASYRPLMAVLRNRIRDFFNN